MQPPSAAIYARASPGFEQDPARQVAEARALAQAIGATVAVTYVEGEARRQPRRAAMMAAAGTRFSIVIVASFCRLASGVHDLLRTIDNLAAKGVRIMVVNTPNPGLTADALLAAAPVLASAAGGMRREAVAKGREKAKARGVRMGRPPVADAKVEKVLQALAAGTGVRPAARQAGVSPATVIRIRAGTMGRPSVG